jgi:BlaI family transcriptional regulator, penicillinase repressor
MVYRLEAKGAVRRTKKIGNAHVFEATTSRASVQTRLLKELLGLFGGSARPVMAHLVEMGKISREDIEDAQKLLRAHTAKDPARDKGK